MARIASTLCFALAAALLVPGAHPAAAAEEFKVGDCYGCHDTIEKLHEKNKHQKVLCDACHEGIAKHLADEKARPATKVGWEVCGGCHKAQYESFLEMSYHRPARDEKSQLTGRSPNPFWDKLMMPHGFTKEHNATRSHAWMVVDQFVVDRAFGGRFQPKNGW
jgi:cytochrome c1